MCVWRILALFSSVIADSRKCSNRSRYCAYLTKNTWIGASKNESCGSCFDAKIKVDLNEVFDGYWFTSEDNLYIAFREKVDFTERKVAYWKEEGESFIYKISLPKESSFGYGNTLIELNLQFMTRKSISSTDEIFAWIMICPCSARNSDDPCAASEDPLDSFDGKFCRSKKKGKKVVCMALCDKEGKRKMAQPNTAATCYRESDTHAAGRWEVLRNRIGSC
ncbi:Oidioi.mRNA.OKI2018_I69.PAR.g8857.t1.cds [Oikopleura dioica]|uniref:Oidioi.mRNA.OKI2018_I69.PAR.g8857.t1.cds n=1 Tax=Oikopleura dioica TaxID=34765 RepID=A0ABN7RHZ1_OIKDI|nr:Oidioi.mRNA.OKI2018_I69.PAR.g8857.t1.cds [Oikopleura dioica]